MVQTVMFYDHLPQRDCFIWTADKDITVRVEKYIPFYNVERFQKRLGQFSPVEYREKLAA